MTRQEFSERTNVKVSDTDYTVIEYVYTHHPSIDAVKGKDQIAMLVETFGMRVIYDMLPTAQKVDSITEEIRQLNSQIAELRAEYEEIVRGK